MHILVGLNRYPTSGRGFLAVVKPELGIKRLCNSCGVRYFDLRKDPITCPKCATLFALPPVAPSRWGVYAPPTPAEKVVAPKVREANEKLDDMDFVVPEDQDDDEDTRGIIGDKET